MQKEKQMVASSFKDEFGCLTREARDWIVSQLAPEGSIFYSFQTATEEFRLGFVEPGKPIPEGAKII